MMKLYLFIITLFFFSCSTSKTNLKTTQNQDKKQSEKNFEYENKAIRYYTGGTVLLNNGEFSKALNEFYQALLYDDKSVEIYLGIAKCLINLNRLETAEINLQKALALDEENIETLLMIAGVQTQLKKSDDATKAYLKVNELEPSNIKAFEMLLFMYTFTKQDDKLIEFIKNRVQFIDPPADLAYSIATYFYKAKNLEKAQEWVTKSLKAQPDYESAKLLQSQLDLQAGKEKDALESFKKIYKNNPDNYRLLYRIIEILRKENQFQEIVDMLQNKKGLGDQFLLFYGEAHYKLENYSEAQKIYAEMSLKDYNSYFLFVAADTELKLQNYETAHAYFSDMIRQNPKEPQGYYGAGFSLIQQKQFKDAEKILREGLVKSNNSSALYALLSETLYELNRVNEAADYIENLLREDPNSFASLTQAASFYQRANKFEQSDKLYERALLINDDDALTLNNYSYSLGKRGIELDRALEMIKKALVKEPNNSFYLDTMGWIYFKLKKYKLAKEFVLKSIELRGSGKESAVVYDHLGDIYEALGEKDKAIENWKKAISKDDTLTEVAEKLKKHAL